MRSVFSAISFAILALVSVPALGANYYVDTTVDTIICVVGNCSLRGAIISANASADDDHIYFDVDGTFLLTLTNGASDEEEGDLDIENNGSLTIHGNSANLTQIDAGGATGVEDRVFDIRTDASVVIENVTIEGGYLTNSEGGGIRSYGMPVIFNSIIKANEAFSEGGGISQINNTIIIRNSTIENNLARTGGGIALSETDATIIETTFYDNETTNINGWIAYGGAIYSSLSDLTLIGCDIDSNHADLWGGGLYLTSSSSNTVSINGCTLSNNEADGDYGEGIHLTGNIALEINDSEIGSHAGEGVYARNLSGESASLVVNKTTISQNGGFYLNSEGTLDVFINRSLIHNNSGSSWGGIWAISVDELIILNSTISGNSSPGSGGGIKITRTNGMMISSTVANNYAAGSGGGISISDSTDYTEFTLKNSIIADNTAGTNGPDCSTYGPDTYTFSSDNGNIIGDSIGCSFFNSLAYDQLDIDPLLYSLSDNGGDTLTHAIDSSSPAYNQIMPSGCKTDIGGAGILLTVDQRGYTRPYDVYCDIGAYEADQ